MNLLKSLAGVCVGAAVIMGSVFGADDIKSMSRVDIQAPDGIKLELFKDDSTKGCALAYHSWLKDEAKKNANAYFQTVPLKEGEWKEYKFVFTTDKDAKVKLFFRGGWAQNKEIKKLHKVWVYFDAISAAGAVLENGDFEEAKDGKPAAWSMTDKTLYLVSGDVKAASGEAMVKSWFSMPVGQTIDVKAGEKVTVTFKTMAGDIELTTE